MPKKKSKQSVDALGQVFDFIFAQSKLPPSKRKPIKLTGLSGESKLSEALVATLERPGVFLTEQAINDLNDALDVSLGATVLDEKTDTKMRVSVRSLPDVIKDPQGYYQKVLDKAQAARKAQRAMFFGETMRELAGNAWARKYADIDTREALRTSLARKGQAQVIGKHIMGNSNWTKLPTDKQNEFMSLFSSGKPEPKEADFKSVLGNAGGEYWKKYSSSISFARKGQTQGKLAGEASSAFGYTLAKSTASGSMARFPDSETTRLYDRTGVLMGRRILGDSDWAKLSADKQSEFLSLFSPGKVAPQEADFMSVLGNVGGKYWKTYRSDTLLQKKDIGSGGLYEALESNNIDRRIKQLENTGGSQSDINTLKKAKLMMSPELTKEGMIKVRGNVEKEISGLKSLFNTTTDAKKRAEINSQIKDLRSGQRSLNFAILSARAGEIEGFLGAVSSVYGSGGLFAALSSTDFYDVGKNPIGGGLTKTDFGDRNGFFVPVKKGNILGDKYNEALAGIYYASPKSLFRTFFLNGEGFAFQAHRNMEALNNIQADFVNKKVLAELIGDKGDQKIRDLLSSYTGSDKNHVESLLKKLQKNAKLQNTFSVNFRFKTLIEQRIGKFFANRRRQIADLMLKRALGEKATVLLAKWVEKGGLQVFVKTLVLAIANTLGITLSGGLANIAIMVFTEIGMDIALKLGKVLFGVLIYALIGAVGLLLIGFSASTKTVTESFSYTNETPGEVVSCPAYVYTPIDDPIKKDINIGEFVAGKLPDGQKCLLGDEGGYQCTQGVYGSFSHKVLPAVDLVGMEYFYAPTFCDGSNCKVVFAGGVNCQGGYAGGMLIFTATYGSNTYEFKLIHVASNLSVGESIYSGQRVARIMTVQETTNACSTGKHLHFEAKLNGKSVDPREMLSSSSSNGGFDCNIGECPPN